MKLIKLMKDQNSLIPTELEQCKNKRNLDKIFKELKGSKPMLISIPHLDINVSHTFDIKQSDAGVFLVKLDMPIKLLNQSYSGSTVNERDALVGSQFKVTPILLSKIGNSYKRLHTVDEVLTKKWTVNPTYLLNVENIIEIPIQSHRHMALALKVEPADKSKIEPFYGLYDIPIPSSQLNGTNSRFYLKEDISKEAGHLEKEDISNEAGHLESIKNRGKTHKGIFKDFKACKDEDCSLKDGDGSATKDLALKLERIRFVRVKSSGSVCETPVHREVIYNIEFCLSNPQHSNLQYRNTPVDVVIEDMSPDENTKDFKVKTCIKGDDKCWKTRITDDSGCVAFPYTMDHFPYNLQKYLLKRITFQAPTDNKSFHSKNRQYVVLNPWEYGFLTYQNVTDTFKSRDEENKTLQEEEKKLQKCLNQHHSNPDSCNDESEKRDQQLISFEKLNEQLKGIISSKNLKPPRIRINEYRSSIIEPSYIIEPSLDITTVKNIQFLVQPSIVRTDSIGETIRQVPNVLPVGYWVMRTILVKGPQETKANTQIIRPKQPIDSFYSFFSLFQKSPNSSLLKQIMSFNKESIVTQDLIDVADRYTANQFEKVSLLDIEESNTLFGKDSRLSQYPKPQFSPEDYISHYDTVVKSENAVVTSFLKQEIRTDQFRHLGSKNAMIIEFYPLDNRGLKHNEDKQCELIPEESNFAVMKKCLTNQQNGSCHDLETPAHWGLFSPSEISSSHIVWPMDDFNSSKTFDIPSLPVCADDHCSDGSQLALSSQPIDNLFDLNVVKEKFDWEGSKESTDRKYNSILANFDVVNDSDIFNTEEYQRFCKKVNKKFSTDGRIDQTDILKDDQKALPDHHWDSCICDMNIEDIPDENIYNGLEFFKDKIRQCKMHINAALKKTAKTTHGINADETGDMCQGYKNPVKYSGGHDYSPSFKSYRDCVCGEDSELRGFDKTEKMARCFSKKEGLIYASTTIFTSDFNRVVKKYNKGKTQSTSESLPLSSYEKYKDAFLEASIGSKRTTFNTLKKGDISSMVQAGFADVEKDFSKRSFLHAMCYYWFNDYYSHIRGDDLKSFYQNHSENLSYLADAHVDKAHHRKKINSLKNRFDEFSDENVEFLDENVVRTPFKTNTGTGHPIIRCLQNPMLFFNLERKVIANKLSSDKTKYNNGRVYTYVHSASQGISSSFEYGRRESRQAKIGSAVAGSLGIGLSLKGDLGVNAESTNSISSSSLFRGNQENSKSITLAVNHINVDLNLEKYRSCLVVRPRSSAFEDVTDRKYSKELNLGDKEQQILKRWPYKTLGLMVCDNEKTESIVVPEDYYYIHQFFGGHSYEFMSRTIYHNRPFIEIIRGQDVMDRFGYLANRSAHHTKINTSTPSNQYHREVPRNLLVERSSLDKTLIHAFEYSSLDRTGFYSGIYTYPSRDDNYYYYNPHISQGQLEQNEERKEADQGATRLLWGLVRKFASLLPGDDIAAENASPPESRVE